MNERWEYLIASIETSWPELLGGAYETLNLYTKGRGVGNVAADFLMDMYHPQQLLSNEEKRSILIGMLPEDDAIELGNRYGLIYSNSRELYHQLKNLKYTARNERILLDFFDIEPQEVIGEEQIIGVETFTTDMLEYPLRGYQRQILSDINNIISEGSRRCMIQMPTGSGKTRTAMYLISEMLNRTEDYMVLWLAYSKELCDQASDEFSNIWKIRGNNDATIYRFYGNSTCNFPDEKINGIVVTTLGKIMNARKKDNTILSMMSDKIDMVVFDEAHQIIAPRYESIVNDIIDLNSRSKLIGLTATPGRTWNNPEEDAKLSKMFYRNIVNIKTQNGESPNDMLTRMGYLSKIEWRHCECENDTLSPAELNEIKDVRDEEIPQEILDKLSIDAKRNAKIVNEVHRLLEEGKKRILIFATSVEHARVLTGIIKIVAKNYDCSVDCIDGSTKSGERDHVIKQFKELTDKPRIICNFGILTTGFDAPNIDAGVIARPTYSLVLFSQMVGRMIRGPATRGGTEHTTIVSVIDLGLPGFKDSHDNWMDVWK